jgi:tetratricopeptide (TPR) repeat protein
VPFAGQNAEQYLELMKKITRFFRALAFVAAVSAFARVDEPSSYSLTAAALKALAAGDWYSVLANCPQSGPLPAVVRAVEGQCLLAINRNDESLAMFISLYAGDARAQWDAWTKAFANQYPRSATAAYLRGDALARLGDWGSAAEQYDRALSLQPEFALALNARGIARMKLGDDAGALTNLEQARKCGPGLADAHASLGVFWLHREAPESADACFRQALRVSTNFALAVNNLGCATYDGQTNDNAAFDLFESAADTPIVAPLARQNAAEVIASETAAWSNALAGAKPGTTISSSGLQGQNLSQLSQIQAQVQNLNQINQNMLHNSTSSAWYGAFGNTLDHWSTWTPVGGAGFALTANPAGAAVAFGTAVAGTGFHEIAGSLTSQAANFQSLAQQQQGQFQNGVANLMSYSAIKFPGSAQAQAFQNLYGNGQPGGATTQGIKVPGADDERLRVISWFGLAQDVALVSPEPSRQH